MAARFCTPELSRRLMLIGAAALPAIATAGPTFPATADTPSADDGPTFLQWERDHEAALSMHVHAKGEDQADEAWTAGVTAQRKILTTPCRTPTAAAVKLRVILHPEVGTFSCGVGHDDEAAIGHVLAFLTDGGGQWEGPRHTAFSLALAAWRAAEAEYGDISNRHDIAGISADDDPELDRAHNRQEQAFAAMLACPTPTRAMLAEKVTALEEREGLNLRSDSSLSIFAKALRRGEG